MKFATLGLNVALTSTTAGTAITLTNTPLLPYRACNVKVSPSGATGTTTMLIEGSENGGTSYVTLTTVTIATSSSTQFIQVKAYPQMRYRNSVAGTAGTANIYIEAI